MKVFLGFFVCCLYIFGQAALSGESVSHYQLANHHLDYIACPKNKVRLLVFIHGSPGASSDYESYLLDTDLQKEFCLVSVDRPGFGKSTASDWKPNLVQQTNAIRNLLLQFIKDNNLSPKAIYLVGHSYGGPLAFLLRGFHNEARYVILLSSPMDPNLEELHWYNHLAAYSVIQFVLPKTWIRSNEEMFTLKSDLISIRKDSKPLPEDILLVHGEKDGLVPFQNTEYLEKLYPNLPKLLIPISGAGHLIPWQEYAAVKESILTFVKRHR
ncbi:alpha/beta hydrolase family protein [Leptospira ryugenii]|uniref:Alpha/beta hydrolase family protein n=1 Tax=Leptospira ryugenii TaxID=1917863 RepID=A0A2P2DVP2_9LEPT|nr:alpha/beta hydrolase [Leptospira ryugenii]GBF48712.1 alpha/beta hydrolase family protein [Leptospira ryugenii]